MKSVLLVAAGAMGAAVMLADCANQSSANASANPTDRTYTSSDLNNTGRHDTAGAIQAIDPSAHVSGGR